MSEYRPPVDEMLFILESVAGIDGVAGLPGCEMLTADLARSVMDEAGELAANVIAPLNAQGDQTGAAVENGSVQVPRASARPTRLSWKAVGEGYRRPRPTGARACLR